MQGYPHEVSVSWPPYTSSVIEIPGFDLDDALREAAEIGVGATILGLRRLNIARRELVERVPAVAPIVDATLDRIDDLAAPVSGVLGSVVSAVGDAVPGQTGDKLNEIGATLVEAGPQLLKLSGLTKR